MSLFDYVTYKYIIIRDKRLGIAYYILAALILMYTVIQIFVEKAYLEFDYSPKGNIRLLVNTPPVNADDDSLPQYCCEKGDCSRCKYLDGLSLNWPVEAKAVTITSFIKEKFEVQRNNKTDTLKFKNSVHSPFEIAREEDYFTLNPEDALIKIEHSITASRGDVAASHRMMNGALYDTRGNVIKILNSSKRSRVDKIFLKEFLKAANISLDSRSDAMNANGRTFRENGVVVQILIEYKNSDVSWFGTGQISYSYRVCHIPFSDYRGKQELPIPKFDGTVTERIVKKRYAVRMEFSQTGKIGHFSLPNLLLQLVSLVGLLTLTATIIDTFALYLIPNKDIYRQYVFDSSPELQKRMQNLTQEEKEKDE